MNDFFSADLTWMTSLNRNETRKQLYIEFNDESASFAFTNEDFCLFKNFPHSNLVFPIINTRRILNCSCTVIWLLKEWQNAENSVQLTHSVQRCFDNFEIRFKNCKFKHKINVCLKKSTNNKIILESASSSIDFHKQTQKYIFISLINAILKFIVNKHNI